MAIQGKLDMLLVTPTTQLVGSSSDEVTKSYTRKTYFLFSTGGEPVLKPIPFISGESLRGIARRRLAVPVMKKIAENSGSSRFDVKLLHTFVDGGMTSQTIKIPYLQEKEVREKFPFFSVFGFGLSLSGKLVIQDAFPVFADRDDTYAHLIEYNSETDDALLNSLLGVFYFAKKDDVMDYKTYIFDFLTEEDVDAWVREAADTSQKRKSGANEFKGTTLTFQAVEYIVPRTKLRTEIATFENEPLTDAEKGCVILAAAELVKNRRVGAYQRKNWGLYDAYLELSVDDEIITLKRETNKQNLLADENEVKIKGGEEYIEAFWDAVSRTTIDDVKELLEMTEKKERKERKSRK